MRSRDSLGSRYCLHKRTPMARAANARQEFLQTGGSRNGVAPGMRWSACRKPRSARTCNSTLGWASLPPLRNGKAGHATAWRHEPSFRAASAPSRPNGSCLPTGRVLRRRSGCRRTRAQDPVPAILEYLPYRRRDGTVLRDRQMHAWFAGHGYAAVRVDMRGSGDSDGLLADEYLPQEQADAVEVIAWLAAQPWCSGAVGMMGISWGGFNALQVASQAAAGAEGNHHRVLDRRSLRRRLPFHGRLPAQQHHRLGLDHVRLRRAAAGPRGGRRALARHVAASGWRTTR